MINVHDKADGAFADSHFQGIETMPTPQEIWTESQPLVTEIIQRANVIADNSTGSNEADAKKLKQLGEQLKQILEDAAKP